MNRRVQFAKMPSGDSPQIYETPETEYIIYAVFFKINIMAKVKFTPIETILEMRENKEKFKIVDVLSAEDYAESHIPDAINIPVENMEAEAPKKLNKDETIIVYCRSYTCGASTMGARKLMEMGFKKVLDYKAGKKGWLDAGLPLIKK